MDTKIETIRKFQAQTYGSDNTFRETLGDYFIGANLKAVVMQNDQALKSRDVKQLQKASDEFHYALAWAIQDIDSHKENNPGLVNLVEVCLAYCQGIAQSITGELVGNRPGIAPSSIENDSLDKLWDKVVEAANFKL